MFHTTEKLRFSSNWGGQKRERERERERERARERERERERETKGNITHYWIKSSGESHLEGTSLAS